MPRDRSSSHVRAIDLKNIDEDKRKPGFARWNMCRGTSLHMLLGVSAPVVFLATK
jgi:hypothetical protein